jgi:UDP-N-acetyl-D-galactosamine dehydrogenase
MGITFKENCPDIRNSKILDIIDELKNWGINVRIDDPWVDPQELNSLHGINIETINSKNQVDALIVAVGHDEYRSISAEELKSYCKGPNPVIADVKSIYKKRNLTDQGFSIFRL